MTGPISGSAKAKVFTETIVWAAPEAYVHEAPYQLAIIEFENGERATVRILGDRVQIGDPVEFVEARDAVAFFRKLPLSPNG
jgi:uncharacterized OB-fold protein